VDVMLREKIMSIIRKSGIGEAVGGDNVDVACGLIRYLTAHSTGTKFHYQQPTLYYRPPVIPCDKLPLPVGKQGENVRNRRRRVYNLFTYHSLLTI
jgi:hypothetical protein